MRMLIADDDPITLRLLENTLKHLNYDILQAHNGQEAWDILHSDHGPDIALLDWIMPGFNGVDLCKKMQQEQPSNFIYTILVTSNDRPEDITTGLDSGANDYITKPFNKEELKSRIAVGVRVVEYERSLKRMNQELVRFSQEMENLAQQRAQQLVQADRMISLGTMAAGIAHEINNPLTIIQGNLALVQGFWKHHVEKILSEFTPASPSPSEPDLAPKPEEVREMIETAVNAVKRIRSIIDGMRVFSHGQGGKIEQIFPLTCLTDAIQICLPKTKHLGGVKTDVEEIPFPVKGNPVQITQVLVNLIANAADALAGTPDPRITVQLRAHNQRVRFEVQDNGPGIPPEAIDQLWSPFYTTKPIGKGTGLGLSICRKIMQDHGGVISVESTINQGTVFTVELPNSRDYDAFASQRPTETVEQAA